MPKLPFCSKNQIIVVRKTMNFINFVIKLEKLKRGEHYT